MGTNFYLHEKRPCDHCGRAYEPLHIGKSSGGWCFSLHVIPERGINTLDDWKRDWSRQECFILDEYGEEVPTGDMERIITERRWSRTNPITGKWLVDNHAMEGPNGLVRHIIGVGSCVGHGEGTWDYIAGEFS